MILQELMSGFETYMATSTRLSARTRELYRREFLRFMAYVGEITLADLSPQVILDWHQSVSGLAFATVNLKRAALNCFLNYAGDFLEDPNG